MSLLSEINFKIHNNTPLLVVISGLSGAGKDSVVEKLKEKHFPFHFIITATSRAPREDEINGVHYFFYTKEEFEQMIQKKELIEHALVYEQYKGVPKSQVETSLASGKDVVVRVDYQGARTIKNLYPNAILIFVMPETPQAWYDRLVSRGQDSEQQLIIRCEEAKKELTAAKDYFDYIVTNSKGELDRAAEMVISIIRSEHQRIRRDSN